MPLSSLGTAKGQHICFGQSGLRGPSPAPPHPPRPRCSGSPGTASAALLAGGGGGGTQETGVSLPLCERTTFRVCG